MTDGKSVIDLSGLAEPVKVLIEKISSGAGVWYEPTRIRRRAKAKADEKTIMAGAETEQTVRKPDWWLAP